MSGALELEQADVFDKAEGMCYAPKDIFHMCAGVSIFLCLPKRIISDVSPSDVN